jgi:aminoglycoside 6-adenylyltransferase
MRTIQQAIDQAKQFAKENDHIRALVFQGSLVMPNPKIDAFTDIDPLFYVDDIDAFIKDESWIDFFGSPIARFSDEGTEASGAKWYARLLLLKDGFKMDVSFQDVQYAKEAIHMPLYKVILDKDNIIPVPPVTDESNFYTKPPTKESFHHILNEFFFDTSYVVKSIRRNELFFTRFMFGVLNKKIKALLGWYLGYDSNYTTNIGAEGRYLFDLMDDQLKQMVLDTFAGKTVQAHLDALYAYFRLVGFLGREIEKQSNLPYLYQVEKEVLQYVKNAQQKPLKNEEVIRL